MVKNRGLFGNYGSLEVVPILRCTFSRFTRSEGCIDLKCSCRNRYFHRIRHRQGRVILTRQRKSCSFRNIRRTRNKKKLKKSPIPLGDFYFYFTNRKKCDIMKLPNKFHNAIMGIFFSFFGKGELYLFSACILIL